MTPTLRLAAALATALALAAAGPAAAETGALTAEAGGGVASPVLTAPYVSGHPALAAAPGPAAFAGVRYALTDDLELGLRLSVTTPVVVDHVWSAGAGDQRLLEHGFQQTAAQALCRRYLAGLDWRLFVEGSLGWDHRRYFSVQPYQVVDGQASSLGVPLPGFAVDDVLVSVGPGVEYVWDHAAVGVRAEVDARIGPSVSGSAPHPVGVGWGFGATVYAAWSFDP